MAYDFFDFGNSDSPSTTLQVDGSQVELPDASFVRDAAIVREGADLVLDGPNGTITVEGYFNAAETPDLVTPEGYTLTPELVESFARSPSQYAQNETFNDVSPVGAVDEITGEASITRMDGSVEPITLGTPVYQGDVIETGAEGAVNISFIDETSFAVSEEARLAIDEYVFDPATEAGTQNFSVLKGVFVFTSGLIGRDDPDDVNIDTPSGSIGIRGTIIAGNADTGEITVVEGAIVVRDLKGNEITLDQQFETAQINPAGGVKNMGLMAAKEMADRFEPVSKVAPTLFSSVNDAMAEQAAQPAPKAIEDGPVDAKPNVEDGKPEGPKPNVDGSVDQNNDNSVDGTVNQGPAPVEGNKPPAGEPVDPANMSPDATTGEMDAPKPAPMPTGQMGMDPMGMNNGGMGSTMPPPPPGGTATAASGTGAMDPVNTAPPPPPPPPPTDTTGTDPAQDPNTIVPPPPGGSNVPPLHIQSNLGGAFDAGQVNIAPSNPAAGSTNYFRVGSDQRFEYHFDLEFVDPDATAGSGALMVGLSGTSRTALTNEFGTEGTGWDFFPTSGHLIIYNTGTIGSNVNIPIEVQAFDSDGNASVGGYQSYVLQAYAGAPGTLANDTVVDGATLTGTSTVDNLNIGIAGDGADGNIIFAGNGDDDLTLVRGANNDIHLGESNTIGNHLHVQDLAANTGNKIYGGAGRDSVRFDNAQNSFFGLDGDDVIKFDTGTTGFGQLNGSLAGHVVDLGHSSFNAAQQLVGLGFGYKGHTDNGGWGDTLFIEGTGGVLDFTSSIAPGYFRGVERIDVKNSGVTAQINLDYQDIVEMTDYKNTLIIRADAGDNLVFNAPDFTGFTKVGDDVAFNDNYDGNGNGNFDIWTDGNVTLLVEDVGATISGLP